jgi:membrane protease subunit (stomatin/prohibitin family)
MARIIDVVDHTNVMDDEFTYREPQRGSGDFRMGSQVIVGESQVAVFIRSGEALDELKTGRHTLSTANIPLLAGLIGMATSGRTPFTADLYFINLKDMPQVAWGTNPPIPLETPGKGMGAVLLSTHGTMGLRISAPGRFLKKFGVGKPITRLGDIKNALQTKLLGELTVLLMGSGVSSVPAANGFLGDLESGVLVKLSQAFEEEYGIQITSLDANPFQAKQASPDELMNYVDIAVWERVKRMQVAEIAAGNEGLTGSIAGAGVGLGVGQMVGGAVNPQQQMMMQQQQMMMQQMMQQMMQNQAGAGQTPAVEASSSATATPQSREEIAAFLDQLDVKLMNGELTEEMYKRMHDKWQAKLDGLG